MLSFIDHISILTSSPASPTSVLLTEEQKARMLHNKQVARIKQTALKLGRLNCLNLNLLCYVSTFLDLASFCSFICVASRVRWIIYPLLLICGHRRGKQVNIFCRTSLFHHHLVAVVVLAVVFIPWLLQMCVIGNLVLSLGHYTGNFQVCSLIFHPRVLPNDFVSNGLTM